MTNEEKLKRIVSSPQLYIESFMKIVDKQGVLVPFVLNDNQKTLLNGLDKYNQIFKQRQGGCTSLACAYSLYLAMTRPSSTCLLVSYSIDSATGIFQKLKQLYWDMPDSIKVGLVANNKKELTFTNSSRIIVATCGTKDVARGLTILFCHCSEVAFFKDNVDKQLLAIEQALTPNGCIILESTANGLNYFSELWNKAERGENMYKPFFFSWQQDKVMHKEEQAQFAQRWIDLHGSLPTIEDLDDEELDLYNQDTSVVQLVWRRLKISNSSKDSFNQEFPHSPHVAFLTTSSNLFNSQMVYERLLHIHESKIISKPLSLPTSLGSYINKTLSIWAIPEPKKRYYIGVDTSEGLNQDYSACEVVSEDGEQVAEFYCNKIKPFQFAEVVNALGLYYNKSLLIIEKASAGHTVCDKLRHDFRYTNMYKHKEYDARGQAKKRVGFITNSKTKPLMINNFVELFETNQLLIHSKNLLNEMKLFGYKNGKQEAINGHDDLVMAMAMALYGLKEGVNYI